MRWILPVLLLLALAVGCQDRMFINIAPEKAPPVLIPYSALNKYASEHKLSREDAMARMYQEGAGRNEVEQARGAAAMASRASAPAASVTPQR